MSLRNIHVCQKETHQEDLPVPLFNCENADCHKVLIFDQILLKLPHTLTKDINAILEAWKMLICKEQKLIFFTIGNTSEVYSCFLS